MNRLKLLWSNLRSSLWFVPSIIVAASVLLAVGMIEADTLIDDHWFAKWPRLFGAGAEGARGMLSTIAGSMMSVVGVTFSMTLVALSMASSQYTSRILRNFMSSRLTQVVLGIFSGIFTYCLIVLRTIRGGDEGSFIPNLAVFVGFILAVGGVGILIFFIHHVASSIQASSIIASITDETVQAIDRLFPEQLGHAEADDVPSPLPMNSRTWHPVPAQSSGYIQSVDDAALLRIARETKTIVRMERGIGEFVVEKTTLVSLDLITPPDSKLIEELLRAFSFSRYRTLEQDASFGIRQLVDVALKALSPGVNDTTTAVTCIHYLTVIMARLAPQQIPPSHRLEEGELRVIAIGPSFQSLLAEAFDQIRESAGGNLAINLVMLDSLQTISNLTASSTRRMALRGQLECITEIVNRTIESPQDRVRIQARLMEVSGAVAIDPP